MMRIRILTLSYMMLMAISWVLASGFTQSAYANGAASGQGSCGTGYGIAVMVMNCVEQSICVALVGTDCDGSPNTSPITPPTSPTPSNLANIISNMQSYAADAAILAVALFGIRLMTAHPQYVEQNKPLSEGTKLLFRIGLVGCLLLSGSPIYAPTLFLTFVNSIGEMISWVVGTGNGGSGANNNGILYQIAPNCSASGVDQSGAPTGMNAGEFAVWQLYDCVFYRLVGSGGSGSGTNNLAINASFIAILLPALISAIFYSVSAGILIVCFGIFALFLLMYVLIRSLYVVLVAYITIAFLMLMAPLFAPLLVFESGYISGLCKKWFFQMVGVVFQPVIIVAFVAFAVATIDQFVEGNLSGCAVGTATSICSYEQLTSANGSTAYSTTNFVDQDGFNLIEWYITGNPQQGGWNALIHGNFSDALKALGLSVIPQPWLHYGLNAIAGVFGLPVLPDLTVATATQKALVAQLALLFGTLLLVCYIFYRLLDTIIQVAASITSADTIAVAGQMFPLPFQNTLSTAGSRAQEGMLKAAEGKSFIRGNVSVRDTLTIARAGIVGGVRGAAEGFFGGGDE